MKSEKTTLGFMFTERTIEICLPSENPNVPKKYLLRFFVVLSFQHEKEMDVVESSI